MGYNVNSKDSKHHNGIISKLLLCVCTKHVALVTMRILPFPSTIFFCNNNYSTKQFKKGVTGLEIAKTISNSLAKAMLALKFNDEIININDPINSNGKIKIITWQDEEGKQTFWHSSAHLMAEAIQKIYPNAKFTIGPAIKNGFYYDIDFQSKVISQDDLKIIESKMLELSKTTWIFQLNLVNKLYTNSKGKKYLKESIFMCYKFSTGETTLM